MGYLVKSPLRANGLVYKIGDTLLPGLPKVDYKRLLSKGCIEKVAEPEIIKPSPTETKKRKTTNRRSSKKVDPPKTIIED